MKYITRAHVHVDRVACPWLIKRFVDSEAEFIFTANEIVKETAQKIGAIPFDIKDAELGHHGDECSFISILKKYNLKDPALLELSRVVNAADTGNMDSNKYAYGLEAIARGYSLMFPDDHDNLERQFLVYDAMYAYFKSNLNK
ncbi:MAG: chromate resistance protein ChrB domain-containing protein [Ignavibacteria bacterium]